MNRNRIFYLLVLVFAAFFYVAYEPWFSWYLLVLTLLFPVFDLLISLPGMRGKKAQLTAPRILEKNAKGFVLTTAQPKNRFPAGQIHARLFEYRDSGRKKYVITMYSTPGSKCELDIDTQSAGFVSYKLKRIWVSSLMGLFSLPSKNVGETSTLILPAPIKPPNTAALPRLRTLIPKPGGGFSEDRDIRPYRTGDPLNSVHWKLTAKHDDMIVREALVPPEHSRLILCRSWEAAEEFELIIGRLLWISDYLLERELPHYVRLEGLGHTTHIESRDDLREFLYRALRGEGEAKYSRKSTPSRFTWVFRIDSREAPQ